MHSLRYKLLLATIAVQVAVVVALLLASHRVIRDVLMAEVRNDARTTELLLATAVAPLLAEKDYAALREVAQESRAVIGLAYLVLYDVDGRALASAGTPPDAGVPLAHADDDDFVAHGGAYHIAAPIRLAGQPYGQMQFGIPSERLAASERRQWLQTIGIGGVGLAASVLLLLLFTGVLTRGLRELAAATARVGAGRYDVDLPVRGRDEVARLATAFNDMSRALAERVTALRDAELRQRTLVEAIAEGVVFRDENDRVLACNEAAPRILALTREQLLGLVPLDPRWRAVDRDGRALSADELPERLARRTGAPQREFVMGIERPDGTRAWVSVNSMPLARAGDDRPHATVTSYADITTRIEAETRLRQINAELEARVQARTRELVTALDAAERASRAKSEFLSRMSHELRTPLNAILGFAQVLRLTADALPARSHEQLRQIEAAGWHLLELINEVLDLSRIESGTMTVSREPLDVAALLDECTRMAEPLARKHDVQLVNRTGSAAVYALGDRTRLKQVVTNLLSNAIKYNRRGGTATLTLARAADGRIEVAVADTGRGFTPQQLEQMFQPFNRLGAEAGPIEGTGIGLVITRRLVELMGGTLHVATTAGAGSVFTVSLPPAREDTASAPAPTLAQAAPAARGTRTLLYIEDNPSNVELLAGVLALRPGLELVVAADGTSGLALAREQRPDLIVVDVALPDIDGYEVCRRLRADAAFARAPIVALSANAMAGDIEKGRRAGFDAYLTKPLDVPAFLAELDRLLGNGKVAR
ncbi:MAG: ATP-binding protein [Burkholderiaceae bacterium]